MEQLQNRIELLGRSLALLAAYAIVAGSLSVILNFGGIAEGEVVAICRAVLGVFGVGAGLLVWTIRRVGVDGWQALTVWSIAQIPFVVWSVDGNPTTQMWDILLGISSSTTVNGVIASSEQYGLNAIGIVLAVWAYQTRELWDRNLKPMLDQPAPAVTGAA